MVVTGEKSEDELRKYTRIVLKLGFDAKFLEFKIQNIVGSCNRELEEGSGMVWGGRAGADNAAPCKGSFLHHCNGVTTMTWATWLGHTRHSRTWHATASSHQHRVQDPACLSQQNKLLILDKQRQRCIFIIGN
jgi:hypothetical protein